jgi:hypothetical protein
MLAFLRNGRGDHLAIGLSGLCVVHCITSALLLTTFASAGAALLHPAVHEIGLALAVLLGVLVLGVGVARHRRLKPALLGGIGLATMGAALLVPHGMPEILCTIAGVVILAFGHKINQQAVRAAC